MTNAETLTYMLYFEGYGAYTSSSKILKAPLVKKIEENPTY